MNALVTWGPYRASRNPMYVGMSLGVAGIALALNTPWLLAILPPVWLLLRRLVIDREEAYLERKFGDAYRKFRAAFPNDPRVRSAEPTQPPAVVAKPPAA